ncbi:MAG: DUF2309 domain-containing protein, partial [Cyclobacteriaceae bacterium]|nr:DUF2309 domain-containing protein [Cyclobacteriaceae bacterium]
MQEKFELDKCLKTIRHYLPAQATLKDFVHHNSLHSFQNKEFFEGIFSASKIFGFQVTFNINEYRKLYEQGRIRPAIVDSIITKSKGEDKLDEYKHKMLSQLYKHEYNPRIGQLRSEWKRQYKIDLDNLVQPLFFRIIGSYLDQGIAIWSFPFEDEGIINAIRSLETNSYSSFFKSKRTKELLFSPDLSIESLLQILVGNTDYYTNYLFDQQYTHKGWSGIVGAIEDNPKITFYKKNIKFRDFVLLELLLEIDALDRTLGKHWKPLAQDFEGKPIDYLSQVKVGELEEILQLWQEAFEWDYYDEVLSGVGYVAKSKRIPDIIDKSFQALFCIDDRECSFRRHIEFVDPQCETLGTPGFFGAAIYYEAYGAQFYDKNCPVPANPQHLIKEIKIKQSRPKEIFHSHVSHTFLRGFLYTIYLGLVAAFRMVTDLFNPKMQPDISNAFAHMDVEGELLIECRDPEAKENGLQVGYLPAEMVDIVEPLLKGIALTENFASFIYVVAHGSSSANNPHHGAHDCGACSGRPGAVNSRVFAHMANHPKVRTELKRRGINIPDSTRFIASMHDTASDEMAYYDEDQLSPEQAAKHETYKNVMEGALDLNAKERAGRFASIDIKKDIKHIRNEIKKRSVSYFEPRPELGHGSNALCHIGAREKLKGLFLDRRAFLQSYKGVNSISKLHV